MITILKHIKNHDKIESLDCMLEVITVLQKNYDVDPSMPVEDWNIVNKWLEKYYCELKEMRNSMRFRGEKI